MRVDDRTGMCGAKSRQKSAAKRFTVAAPQACLQTLWTNEARSRVTKACYRRRPAARRRRDARRRSRTLPEQPRPQIKTDQPFCAWIDLFSSLKSPDFVDSRRREPGDFARIGGQIGRRDSSGTSPANLTFGHLGRDSARSGGAQLCKPWD